MIPGTPLNGVGLRVGLGLTGDSKGRNGGVGGQQDPPVLSSGGRRVVVGGPPSVGRTVSGHQSLGLTTGTSDEG